jgi:hypothetical protein
MTPAGRLAWALLLALAASACASQFETVDRTSRGPTAQELFTIRSYAVNGREPSFDERRMWEDQIDARIAKYLREHPELQQTPRYSDFRFWKQVTPGSTAEEVRVLLEEPAEQTIDPALMAAMSRRHWSVLQGRAREAWVYPPGWVIYFGDEGVIEMTRRTSTLDTSPE